MRYLGLAIIGLCLIWPVLAHADGEPLQTILAAPEVTIEGDKLSVDELNSFYAARDYRPAWNFSGADNSKAFNAFLDSIDQLIAYHGLQNQDYPVAVMHKLAAASDAASKNQLELVVTDTLLVLAHDLHGDAINLNKLYDGWTFHRDEMDIPTLLAAAVASNQLDAFIDALTPRNPAYTQLAKILKTYQALEAKGAWPKIDPGPTIRPNDHGPRIAQLRARLVAEDYLPPSQGDIYDADLQKAMQTYQLRNGLEADGNVGAKTIDVMNVSIPTRIDQIRANMERWRHMPDSFPPDRYVLVNIPDVTIDIVEDKKSIFRDRVIVGRIDRKTPFIDSVVRSMIINPVWHVPISIARKDILPKLRRDPHYLEKLGFTIADRSGDPYGEDIDWQNVSAKSFDYVLRQSPGDKNSLGRLKFDFNNDFAVYMHGTPHQELFNKNERNLSSGCVRLRDPLKVAELLLAPNTGDWTSEKIEAEINENKTHWVGLQQPIPIFIVYWTVFQDEAGNINFRNDPYGYDGLLMESLKTEARLLPDLTH